MLMPHRRRIYGSTTKPTATSDPDGGNHPGKEIHLYISTIDNRTIIANSGVPSAAGIGQPGKAFAFPVLNRTSPRRSHTPRHADMDLCSQHNFHNPTTHTKSSLTTRAFIHDVSFPSRCRRQRAFLKKLIWLMCVPAISADSYLETMIHSRQAVRRRLIVTLRHHPTRKQSCLA